MIKQVAGDPTKFTFENRLKNTTVTIRMIEGNDGSIVFEGLPNFFSHFINTFTNDQKKESPLMVLDSAVRSYETIRSKPGDLLDTI